MQIESVSPNCLLRLGEFFTKNCETLTISSLLLSPIAHRSEDIVPFFKGVACLSSLERMIFIAADESCCDNLDELVEILSGSCSLLTVELYDKKIQWIEDRNKHWQKEKRFKTVKPTYLPHY